MRALFIIVFLVPTVLIGQSLSFDWVKTMGGKDIVVGNSMVTDQAGNIYIAGEFRDSMNLNPNGNSVIHVAHPPTSQYSKYNDLFVAKYTSTGQYIWSKSFGGVYSDAVHSMALDSSGNIYIVGEFMDVVDFDPGPSSYFLTVPSRTYYWSGGANGFILKLNSSGQFQNAYNIGGFLHDEVNDIEIDDDGNIFLIGSFSDTLILGSGTNQVQFVSGPLGSTGTFVAKYSPNFNLIWAKSFTGIGRVSDSKFDIDKSGNIICTGKFESTINFNPGTTGFTRSSNLGAGSTYGYLLRMDEYGVPQWVNVFKSKLYAEGIDVATDDSLNIYAMGMFKGETNFDPGSNNYILTFESKESQDMYISKFDSSGNIQWVKHIGTEGKSRKKGDLSYIGLSQIKPRKIEVANGRDIHFRKSMWNG